MTATPPTEGLLAGLRLGLGTGDPYADSAALRRVEDWQAVAALSEYHRVGPLLLNGLGAREDLLERSGIAPRLRRRRNRIVRRNLRQLALLKQAAWRLSANGVPFLVLKGMPLHQRLYGSPMPRGMKDIDLLVPANMLPCAERALGECGLRRSAPGFKETPMRTRLYRMFLKDCSLTGSGPGRQVELHWRLTKNPFLLPARFEELYAGSVLVPVGDSAFRTLGDDDQLLYLATHGQGHQWRRIKWLCDIASFLSLIEEARLVRAVERSRECGLDNVLAATLALCRELLHAEVPKAAASLPFGATRARLLAHVSRRAWEERPALLRAGTPDRETRERLGRVLMKASSRFVLHEMLSLFVQPQEWGRARPPDKLFFLYVALRPFLRLIEKRRTGAKVSHPG